MGPHEATPLAFESQGEILGLRIASLEGWDVMTAGTGMYGQVSVTQRDVRTNVCSPMGRIGRRL